jgi:hypothetical protein
VARKRYSIYKLTSPSGRSYVGFTGQSVAERWRQHVARAMRGARHPLCAAIRKYGADRFVVETLSEYGGADLALRAEVDCIAELTNAYNISPGGDFDGGAGAARFRELLADPAWRADYCARLGAALRDSPAYQARVPELVANLAAWRESNPAEAYRISLRNLRLGGGKRKKQKPDDPQRLPRKPNGPAAKLHKSRASRNAAERHWAEMTPEKKAAIAAKISASVKARHAAKTDAEREAHNAQLAEARKRIDHDVRKTRQKAALERYWTTQRCEEFGRAVRARNAKKKEARDVDI